MAKHRVINKVIAIIVISILSIGLLITAGLGISTLVQNDIDEVNFTGSAKNVILIIGDGMGFEHIETYKAYSGNTQTSMETAPIKGEVNTHSLNLTMPTDSAAAGTALATGNKTYNGELGGVWGVHKENLSEYAMSKGMATGVVVTEGVDGATPSAFSAHALNRELKGKIFKSQMQSDIDLFMGTNSAYYNTLQDDIKANGYDYITEFSDFDMNQDRIFATFDKMAVGAEASTEKTPKLQEASIQAINYLNNHSENGFFLMIEESHIDKFSHKNEMEDVMQHMDAIHNTVSAVVDLANEIGDTIVIVTADHETGGLQYDNQTKAEISNDMFTRGGHSSSNVPYFMFGNIQNVPKEVENVQISMIIKKILGA